MRNTFIIIKFICTHALYIFLNLYLVLTEDKFGIDCSIWEVDLKIKKSFFLIVLFDFYSWRSFLSPFVFLDQSISEFKKKNKLNFRFLKRVCVHQ